MLPLLLIFILHYSGSTFHAAYKQHNCSNMQVLLPYWKSSSEVYWRRDANLKQSSSHWNVLGVRSLSRLQTECWSIPLHTRSDLSSGGGQMSSLTPYFIHVPVDIKLVCLVMGWHHQIPSKYASACHTRLSSPGAPQPWKYEALWRNFSPSWMIRPEGWSIPM